jgi:hypothetical protein
MEQAGYHTQSAYRRAFSMLWLMRHATGTAHHSPAPSPTAPPPKQTRGCESPNVPPVQAALQMLRQTKGSGQEQSRLAVGMAPDM